MPRRIRRDTDRPRRTGPDQAGYRKGRRNTGVSEDAFQPILISPVTGELSALALLPDQGRVIGVDYGARRIGLSVSDPAGRIALALDTIEVNSMTQAVTDLIALSERYGACEIVVGLPINMDGAESEMAKTVLAFVSTLQAQTDTRVKTWDERLTSAAAQRAVTAMGLSLKGNKKQLDRIAATLLLQSYLERQRQPALVSASDSVEEICHD